jgi:hypothetical protein
MNTSLHDSLADIFGAPAAAPTATESRIASVKEVLKRSSALAAPAASAKVAPELITEPGVFQISNEEYHADPVATPSMTRGTVYDLINETPAHAFYNHPRLSPKFEEDTAEEDTAEAKFDLGTAWHSLLFEGEQLAVVVDPRDYPGPKGGVPKGWTTDVMRAMRTEIRQAGKIPMLPPQYKKVMEMVQAAHKFLAESELGIKDLHAEGAAEQTYVWQEGDTWFRVRPDWTSHKNFGDRKLILDGKSVAQSANPDRFKPSEHGKDIQRVLYPRGVAAVEGGKRPKFLFLVQENFPPYLCSLVGLDPQTIQIAEQKIDFAKYMWEQCHALGEWDGYPKRACYVESKPWEVAAWEAKSASIGQEE